MFPMSLNTTVVNVIRPHHRSSLRIGFTNVNLSFSCLNKFNQLFHIVKIIIIANDSFAMI